MMASPWGDLREVEWRSALELKQLFDSEGLNAQYGNFLIDISRMCLSINAALIDKPDQDVMKAHSASGWILQELSSNSSSTSPMAMHLRRNSKMGSEREKSFSPLAFSLRISTGL